MHYGKGTVFFYFPGIVCFLHILGKNRLSEWKMCFFFSTAFFFSGLPKLSEWVGCKLFLEKKVGKKKQPKCEKITKNTCFWPFFVDICAPGEWVAFKLFLGKKKHLVFFLWKKKTKFSKIEWVSGGKLFPGKKIRYLWCS